jgi:hypothetical protein
MLNPFPVDWTKVFEVEHRVDHELPGAVEGDESAAVGADKVGAEREEAALVRGRVVGRAHASSVHCSKRRNSLYNGYFAFCLA